MVSQADCIFCKIAGGQVPCHKLYEDEQVVSFLDAGPLTRGHTLVVPKAHYMTLEAMPAELAGSCMAAVARVGRAVVAATGAGAWNVLQNNGRVAGQVVEHVHFHIIPRAEGDGLGYRWPAGTLDKTDAEQLVGAITEALSG
ncbi:MAG: HIT family protein [Phycisphaeraceae bacterium]